MEPKANDCLEMVPQVEKESPYGTKKKLDLIIFQCVSPKINSVSKSGSFLSKKTCGEKISLTEKKLLNISRATRRILHKRGTKYCEIKEHRAAQILFSN